MRDGSRFWFAGEVTSIPTLSALDDLRIQEIEPMYVGCVGSNLVCYSRKSSNF